MSYLLKYKVVLHDNENNEVAYEYDYSSDAIDAYVAHTMKGLSAQIFVLKWVEKHPSHISVSEWHQAIERHYNRK